MYVILAHAGDRGAAAVAAWLRRNRGPHSVRIVRPEALSTAAWSHRIDAKGRAMSVVTLPRQAPLASDGIAAVLNRLHHLPVPGSSLSAPKDRDFAIAEWQALIVSWLAELGTRVVHQVRRHPWLTPMLSPQQWAAVAAAHALPVAPRSIDSRSPAPPPATWESVSRDDAGTVLVAGANAGGVLAERYGKPCVAAAAALGLPLLEFRFQRQDGRPVLTAVDALPSLVEPWAAKMAADLLEAASCGEAMP